MGSVGLLYVGAVLFINGLSLVGWVKGKSLIPMNVFVGILQVVTPLYLIFTANGDQATILGASGLFLFGFTYLYVAMNNAFNLDGSGLGWFCLYVVGAALVYAWFNLRDANAAGYIFGVLWLNWAFLWFLFWLVLSLGKTSLTRFTGAVCASQGILTAMVPALILLGQPSLFVTELAWAIAGILLVLYVVFYFTVKTAPATQAPSPSPAY
jgi:putative amide transporter protein